MCLNLQVTTESLSYAPSKNIHIKWTRKKKTIPCHWSWMPMVPVVDIKGCFSRHLPDGCVGVPSSTQLPLSPLVTRERPWILVKDQPETRVWVEAVAPARPSPSREPSRGSYWCAGSNSAVVTRLFLAESSSHYSPLPPEVKDERKERSQRLCRNSGNLKWNPLAFQRSGAGERILVIRTRDELFLAASWHL